MSYNDNEKRDLIMNHYLKPQYKKEVIKEATVCHGQVCSDYLEFDYKLENGKIKDLYFAGYGCAFYIAASDMLCAKINGMKIDEAILFIDKYVKFIKGEKINQNDIDSLGELGVFDNVKKQANRIHCATLLANALSARLKNERK